MSQKTTPKTIDFEKSLQQLEAIVSKLEKGELSLEESIKHFEQGIKLSRECQQALRYAEQKITVLSKENGDWAEKDLDGVEQLEGN